MSKFQLLKYLSVILIGVFISSFIFYTLNQRKVENRKADIETAISKSIIKLNDELNKVYLVMESMSFFFENRDSISQERFERLTLPYLKQLKSISALAWAPRKSLNDSIQNKGLKTPYSNIEQGAVKPYDNLQYPITLLSPIPDYERALGYDIYKETNRKEAIVLAEDTQGSVLTSPVDLIHDSKKVPGFLVYRSVQDPKRKNKKGVVAGVYQADNFISQTLKNELRLIDICIFDSEVQSKVMFESTPFNDVQSKGNKAFSSAKIKASNREWNVIFKTKEGYLFFPHVPESYIVLVLGLLATVLLLNVIRKNDLYNDRLEARVLLRTAELEASNKMKENLLREIHHRVKNNLQITSSLMNMQKRKLNSKEAITALSDSQARISAIALTHQKIYQDKDSKAVNLNDYLIDLMEYQKKISSSFTYKIVCPYISIELDRAVPLALIISELVTNAVKHAYPDTTKYNELLVEVSMLSDISILLSIKDNGKGLPEDFNIDKAEGIGFEIIRALCRQISAQLKYESTDYGTQFDLIFDNKA